MSIYIHIPFCSSICSYCDFCKLLKNQIWIDEYLSALKKEVELNYKGEKINTIYIGGGTPSVLDLNQLKKLFEIISIFNLNENAEITFESNSEDLTIDKILYLKNKVNRLSIGVQTFNKNNLKLLNRKLNINNVKQAFKHFKNINIDLMYGFHNQNLNDLNDDINKILKLNPMHISTYCLIIEKNTKLYIENYQSQSDDNERKMYDFIIQKLKQNGYHQYEFSNFSKKNYESKHNLVYWNNENYYGFGLGASGYLNNVRYENTRSLSNYLKGNYKLESHVLTIDEKLQNEFILGFRKIKGINKQTFFKKYKKNIKEIQKVEELLKNKILKENETNIYINPKYIYVSNEILLNFVDISLHKH